MYTADAAEMPDLSDGEDSISQASDTAIVKIEAVKNPGNVNMNRMRLDT